SNVTKKAVDSFILESAEGITMALMAVNPVLAVVAGITVYLFLNYAADELSEKVGEIIADHIYKDIDYMLKNIKENYITGSNTSSNSKISFLINEPDKTRVASPIIYQNIIKSSAVFKQGFNR